MLRNHGIRNEYLFIQNINNRKFRNLNILLQELVEYLFPDVKNDDIIKCYKNIEYEKGDICIIHENKKKFVSIKMGHGNSVHGESVQKFIKFLKELNLEDSIINEILKYQYADGTVDGSGVKRLSSNEYKENNIESIKVINDALRSERIIKKIVERFIIKGTQKHLNSIDVLVYGTYDNFLFITPNEIYNYIISKINYESSSIHFSNLTFQPQARVLDYDPKKEYMRHWIQIKWYNLEDNIIEILNMRAMKKNGILF